MRSPTPPAAMIALLVPVLLASREPRIVGGAPVAPGAYPWMSGLWSPGDTGPFCGGSLIRSSWVLTAAHCVVGTAPADLQVVVGLDQLPNSGVTFGVAALVVHPAYDSVSEDSDIALIELAGASSAPSVEEADAAVQNSLVEGELATALGWGSTSYPNLSFPSSLYAAALPFISTDACNLTAIAPVTQNQICAGFPAGGVDTCAGDSGGPLFVVRAGQPRVIGITSFGDGCALPNTPGVYTDVANYQPWIVGYAPEPQPALQSLAGLVCLAGLASRGVRPRPAHSC